MATRCCLLCIHHDPAQLSLLQESGFDLVTASNGREGLKLFMTQPVDAIVLEYHLGLLDGATIASHIKKIRPHAPIVMVIDHLEVPDGALKSVDMVVAKCDGEGFLLAAVHSVLGQPPTANIPREARRPNRVEPMGKAASAYFDPKPLSQAVSGDPILDDKSRPFSPEAWLGILDGTIRFTSDRYAIASRITQNAKR
jgi:CheY-like chemotaxis protein